jgi:hypothetical protein
MKNSLQAILKITALTVILASSLHLIHAAPGSPPSSNIETPVNVGSQAQLKSGPLYTNTSGSNAYGFINTNNFTIKPTAANYGRLVLDDRAADTAAGYSGIHFQKNNAFKGGLFRKDGNNEIQLWNTGGPVISMDNGAKITFNGKLRIADGTQAAGSVLTSDSSGNTSWKSVSSVTSGLGVKAFFTWKRTTSTEWGTLDSSNINPVSPRTPEVSPYYVDVTFATQMSDANYVVNCNGTRYSYNDPMWMAADTKSTSGFSVHGYIVSSSDETPGQIGTLDCVVYGGGSSGGPVYSNMLTKFTKSANTLYPYAGCSYFESSVWGIENPDDLWFDCDKDKTDSTYQYGAGAYSNKLTFLKNEKYVLTYQSNSNVNSTIKLVSTATGDYRLSSIGINQVVDSTNYDDHTITFIPTANITGYLQITMDPSVTGFVVIGNLSLHHI